MSRPSSLGDDELARGQRRVSIESPENAPGQDWHARYLVAAEECARLNREKVRLEQQLGSSQRAICAARAERDRAVSKVTGLEQDLENERNDLRCRITGSECGTWMEGHPCSCPTCAVYLRIRAEGATIERERLARISDEQAAFGDGSDEPRVAQAARDHAAWLRAGAPWEPARPVPQSESGQGPEASPGSAAEPGESEE